MVTSLWNKIEIYCAHHETPVTMPLISRRGTVFYECERGSIENLNDESCLCKNSLPLKDFEKLLDHISAIMYEAALNNEEPNLKNMKFAIGKFKYKIIEHDDIIKVIVQNTRL